MKGNTVDLYIPTKQSLQSVFALHSFLKNVCILIVFLGVTNSTHAQDTLLLNEGRLLENPNQDIGVISLQNNQVVNKQILPPNGVQTHISDQLAKNVNSIITYDDKLKSIDQDAKTVFEKNIGYRDSYEDVLLIPEVHSGKNAAYQPSVISSKPFVYNEQISGFESAVNFILL
ncbi:hypothetical protein, partial [Fodinibius sp.]|uniref:hypothetical protein n=1 Tax=Fodinibius sp. TaxID=1872440 RepID=UPI00356291C2